MWTAAAGAVAQAQNLDVIANNLANTDTPAFKKDVPTFREYLATVERNHDVVDIPRGPIKDKEFYPIDGRDQSQVLMDGTHASFKMGTLRVTQGQLDLALDGPGFLEIATPQGIRYTRQGSLKTNNEGRLVTSQGYPVLAGTVTPPPAPGANLATPPIETLPEIPNLTKSLGNQIPPELAPRYINLKDKGAHFAFTPSGEIYSGDVLVGKVAVVEFKDLSRLKKYGDQIFENTDANNRIAPQFTQVRQGVIETSNVSPIEEMTNLIKSNRLFEHDLKALKTYGEMMGREVNDIGKL